MDGLGWQAWMTVGVLAAMIGALVKEVARPDLIILGSLGILLLAGIVSPQDAFVGFSNPAVLTVGALFVVAAGVQRTEALGALDRILFRKSQASSYRLYRVLPRLMLPTSFLSAFLNNTPIVAMLTPRVQQWSERTGVPASKLLMPLSYAAIVGGMVTLIGTSTNLVVSGLLQGSGYEPLGLFDLTWVGAPAALAVIVYLAFVGHRLLPHREQEGPEFEDGLQDCLFELQVEDDLAGQTIEEAGLRALGDAYLVHVRRSGRILPVAPDEVLQAGDVLTFTGKAAMIDELLQRSGLDRSVPELDEEDTYQTLPLYEAVVAESSELVGQTLREASFREHYGGVVLAIQRKDERIEGALGRVPIKAGDLLLIEAREWFAQRWNARRDVFYLVAPRRGQQVKPQSKKAPLALLILVGMIVVAATDLIPLVTAAFAAALAMVLTRCLRGEEARRSVDLQVLVVIAAALGIGQALETTGLAAAVAHAIVDVSADYGVLLLLIALYIGTNVLTEFITNNAAAVLMLPVALAAAVDVGADPKAFALTVAIAASASFMTPIGYQTNLMVMAAGGYRFRDYFRAGLPVSLIVMSITMVMLWLIWL